MIGRANIQALFAMNNAQLFDEYLTAYQGDLKRIIGKHRRSTHYLTNDEILSDVNLSLFNNKEQLLSEWTGKFDRIAFAKLAYAYARNLIVWSHSRISKSAAVRKRVDFSHADPDGISTSTTKSTFDLVTESLGEEEKAYESFDSLDKIRHTLKMIREYAHILSEQELLILRLVETGKNQREIAAHVNVTHQAVSSLFLSLSAKIKNYIKFDFYSDDSFFKISEGDRALKYFFTHEALPLISAQDRNDLLALLTANPKKYTLLELAAEFKNGKYTHSQLIGVCNGLGVSGNLRRLRNPYSIDESERLIALAEEGLSVEEISKKLQRNSHSIGVKCAYLRKKGKLGVRPPLAHHPTISPAHRAEIIDLFKTGLTSVEISEQLGIPVKHVGGVRGSLTRKGILEPTNFKTAYTPEMTQLIIEMANKGVCLREISAATGRSLQSLSRKCTYLRNEGLLETVPCVHLLKNQVPQETKDTILRLLREGRSSYEIAKELDLPVSRVAAFRSSFVKCGLLPLMQPKFSREIRERMFYFFEEGHSCRSVADKLRLPVSSVRNLRRALVVKGLLERVRP